MMHRTNPNVMTIDKDAFKDDTLTVEAKGVLITLMANEGVCGELFKDRYSVQLNELEAKGYLVMNENSGTIASVKIGSKRKAKDYKRILEDALGLKWDRKLLEVHHINHDRSDNRIENLLLLPKKLHRLYHFYYNACSYPCIGNLLDKKINAMLPDLNDNIIQLSLCKSDMAILLRAQKNVLYSPCQKEDSIEFMKNTFMEYLNKYS